MSSFWSDKIVKTRKEHRCFGCGRMIPVGSTVYKGAGKVFGEFNSLYQCEYCQENRNNFCDDDGISYEMDGFEYLRRQNMDKAVEVLLKKNPELQDTKRYFLVLSIGSKFSPINARHFDFYYKKNKTPLFTIFVPLSIGDEKTEDDKFYCID